MACYDPCRDSSCESVFSRVHVSLLTRGGSRISWTIRDNTSLPSAYSVQVQYSPSGVMAAEDWENVGEPVTDGFFLHDVTRRIFGKSRTATYRLKLVAGDDTYYSLPTPATGILPFDRWQRAKEIVRKELVNFRIGAGQRGYLLRRRRSGPRCSCADPHTGEPVNSQCLLCFATGFFCGYYPAVGCSWADLSLRTVLKEVRSEPGRQTGSTVNITARMLAEPMIETYDVWVDAATDDRYIVGQTQVAATEGPVPLVLNVELRLAPASHIIYAVPIPEQLQELGLP